jgi:uncharacterized protein (TIGR02145 family)
MKTTHLLLLLLCTISSYTTWAQMVGSPRMFTQKKCGGYVAAGVFKEFMCHNLGADTSLDPNLPVQGIHGNYYQWGRATVVADATSSAAISGWNTTLAPDGSWSDTAKTANDPCPAGYRIPTKTQWEGVIANNTASRIGSWTNSSTNYGSAIYLGSKLCLPTAGYCHYSNGIVNYRGLIGYYWSSTESGTNNASAPAFSSSSANLTYNARTDGFSIRCISE